MSLGLYAIKWTFQYLTKRYPRHERVFFFISVLRNAFVIVVLTIAAWLYSRHRKDKKGNYPISLLLTVPRGFQVSLLVAVLILINISISPIGRKDFPCGPQTRESHWSGSVCGNYYSIVGAYFYCQMCVCIELIRYFYLTLFPAFGRVNGYRINPAQELIAIGVTNTIGTVFHAYPATGSFSRSALKAKSGVRTPLAGMVTGLVVIVALYGLTSAFFWIPSAGWCRYTALDCHDRITCFSRT